MSTEIFNTIAPGYDRANKVISLGFDNSWRLRMLHFLPQVNHGELRVLDLATGTADAAIALARDQRVKEVIGVDIAEAMLSRGRSKVKKAGLSAKVRLLTDNALALNFPDKSFDVVTAAFGVRNFSGLMQGLMEACRVLKPGGTLIILEFSIPSNCVCRHCHSVYLKYLIPCLGALITGKSSAYIYLAKSILGFPNAERFCCIIRQVGFSGVERSELLLGAVSIYAAQRRQE